MPDTPKPQNAIQPEPRYVTPLQEERAGIRAALKAFPDPTPLDPESQEGPYRLYRLCPCGDCNGTGKTPGPPVVVGALVGQVPARCKSCRGEGRTLELVATATDPESVGVALVTLAAEGEWDGDCPLGLMDRPEGQKGVWLIKPWQASARNVSDAGRTLARSKNTSR